MGRCLPQTAEGRSDRLPWQSVYVALSRPKDTGVASRVSSRRCASSRRTSYVTVAPTPGQVGAGAHTGGGARDLPMPRLPYATPRTRPTQHSWGAWSKGARPRPGCLGAAGCNCGAIRSTADRGRGIGPPHSKWEGFSSQSYAHACHVGNTQEGVSSPAHRTQLQGADHRVHVLGGGGGTHQSAAPRGVLLGREGNVKCDVGKRGG